MTKILTVKAITKLGVITILWSLFVTYYPQQDGIIRHDVSIEVYRTLGNLPDFDCVGRYAEDETSTDFAAGVLIAPNWVLTAAHFVQAPSVWKFGNHFYQTLQIVKHPKLQIAEGQEAQWMGRDLALVELVEPVWDVRPATRFYGYDELGKIITKVGYGYLGDGAVGMLAPRQQEKMGGTNTIDAVGGRYENRSFSTDVLVCDFDHPDHDSLNHFGSPIPLDLEIGGSKGDSGGGVFIEQDGQVFLVGIVSGALNREIKYGAVMSLARVSTANKWIDSVLYD